jgi:hypothetical protein
MPLILGTNSIKDTGYDVANSLRFDDGSSDRLRRTPSSAGNRRTFTFSTWVKRSALGSSNRSLICATVDDANKTMLRFTDSDQLRFVKFTTSSVTNQLTTNAVFRDVSAWYHIVIAVDTTNSTAGDRLRLYVNGSEITSFSAETQPSLNFDYDINNTEEHNIGYGTDVSNHLFDGYMAETIFIDGQQLAPTLFGEFDEDSPTIWKPKDVSGLTFGTNGFHLDFENASSLGADVSGNSNNFTVNNLTSIDQSTDTCTNNFATFNYLQSALNGNTTTQTFSEGNLQVVTPNTNYSKFGGASTIGASQGKWYAEIRVSASGGTYPTYQSIGITGDPSHNANTTNAYIGGQSFSAGYYNQGGLIQVNNSTVFTYGTTESVPYDVMIAMDLDNNKVYFGIDGTWVNSGDPAGGTGGFTIPASSTVPTGNYFFATYSASSFMTSTYQANFGNPPYSISSGNSDANGYGNFEYSVPSGFYSINTKNLAEFG